MNTTENTSKNKKNRKIFVYIALLLFFLALLIAIVSYLYNNTIWFGGQFRVLDKSSFIEMDLNKLPKDTVFVTKSRMNYKDNTMYLVIPRIELNTPVGGDTLPQTLIDRPGIYEYSQMPGKGDVNVSIAGHRDLGKMEFYDLDKISDGDKLFLIYNNTVYEYVFYSSRIVPPNDWSVITRQGFSVLTLTTCDPIGTNINRLVVVGSFVKEYPLDESVIFE